MVRARAVILHPAMSIVVRLLLRFRLKGSRRKERAFRLLRKRIVAVVVVEGRTSVLLLLLLLLLNQISQQRRTATARVAPHSAGPPMPVEMLSTSESIAVPLG